MDIIYLILAFTVGLYANSLFNNALDKFIQYFVIHNIDDISEKFNDEYKSESLNNQKISKFQQRINDAVAKSKQN